jgi:PAS domain S-box-containing protein
VLEAQGIQAVLSVPIYVEDEWWGFIGFDDVVNKRVWGSVEIEATKAAAHIIAAAIQHSASRQALHDSEERFRSLASNNPDQVTIYRADGKILYAHSPEDSHPGMTLDKHVGQLVFECLEPVRAAQTRDRVREALDTGLMQNTRYALQETDGPRYYEERFIPLSSDQVMSIMRDTTELHKTEQKLLKIQKLESVGVLAGGIAHDFNNILTGVLGNVSLAMVGMNPEDGRIELLKECENAVMRAKGLTHQLLTFSKGGKPVRRSMEITNLVMETVAFSLRGSNVKPVYDIQGNLPSVEIDADQISQVIQNIVTNADQAMPDGGSLFVKIDKTKINKIAGLPVAPGEYLRLSFRDQGTGIIEEHLNRVFDPYFTTKQTGSGLGLASCYSIISNHGGAIDVKSKVSQGTEFTLILPTSASQPSEHESVSDEELKGNGRILLMDDEKTIRALGQKILQEVGYRVDVASDGNSAVILFKQAQKEGNPYAAVVLDLTIPGGVGGEETMKKLLELDPKLRGIVCSGYSEHPLMTEHQRYGFGECITKPFRARDLLNAVARLLKPKLTD